MAGARMAVARRWVLREADPERVETLSRDMRIPAPVARVLVNRGVEEVAAAERFLSPTLRDLHPPEGLADMDRATSRILDALQANEPILVYGDYDADGLTAVALLMRFLKGVGARVSHVIPHRARDGYGVHLPLLQQARREGIGLAITVDCGISDGEAIARAREMGMEVIVTDHHEVPSDLPPAHAVVNPKRSDNRYPFSDLAGVGVALLLVWAVARRLRERGFWGRGEEPSLKEYLDLVALGTVADQSPLVGENRTLVKHGLHQLALHPSPGVTALLQACGSWGKPLSVGTVSFQLAPRLNAPGRMEEALPALELLLAEEPQGALELAGLLDGMNRRRQQIEERIFREADLMAEQEIREGRRALVLSKEGWHPGVVGIVASRLTDRYGLPAVLVAVEGGVGKGSARAPDGFHLMEGLRACEGLLERYGGHRLAAGLRIDPGVIQAFRETFCQQAQSILGDRSVGGVVRIDDRLTPAQVNEELVRHLSRLGPHGVGNPEPVFQMDRLEISQCRRVGQDHVKLWVRQGDLGFDAIGFGMGSLLPETVQGWAHLACIPQLNEWQGRTSIQLKLKDVKLL